MSSRLPSVPFPEHLSECEMMSYLRIFALDMSANKMKRSWIHDPGPRRYGCCVNTRPCSISSYICSESSECKLHSTHHKTRETKILTSNSAYGNKRLSSSCNQSLQNDANFLLRNRVAEMDVVTLGLTHRGHKDHTSCSHCEHPRALSID